MVPSTSPCSSPAPAVSCPSGLAGSGRSAERGPSGLSQLPSRCRTWRPHPQLQPQRDEGVKATCAPYTPQSGVTLALRHHLDPINTCKRHGASHGKVPGAPGRQSWATAPGAKPDPSITLQADVSAGCAQPPWGSGQECSPRHQQGAGLVQGCCRFAWLEAAGCWGMAETPGNSRTTWDRAGRAPPAAGQMYRWTDTGLSALEASSHGRQQESHYPRHLREPGTG